MAASNPEFGEPDSCGCTGSEVNNLSLGAPQLELTTVQLNSLWIPQFGHGAGAGNQFSSEIRLLNLSPSASQVQVSSFDSAGNPSNLLEGGGAPAAEVERALPALGTARVNRSEPRRDRLGLGAAASA